MASGIENKTISLNKLLAIDGQILTAFVHTLGNPPEKSLIYLFYVPFEAAKSSC